MPETLVTVPASAPDPPSPRAMDGSAASTDSDQQSLQGFQRFGGGVYLPGQCFKLRMVRADDEALVIRIAPVEADEVIPMVAEEGTAVCDGEAEPFLVGDALPGFPFFVGRGDIVAEPAQRHDAKAWHEASLPRPFPPAPRISPALRFFLSREVAESGKRATLQTLRPPPSSP